MNSATNGRAISLTRLGQLSKEIYVLRDCRIAPQGLGATWIGLLLTLRLTNSTRGRDAIGHLCLVGSDILPH